MIKKKTIPVNLTKVTPDNVYKGARIIDFEDSDYPDGQVGTIKECSDPHNVEVEYDPKEEKDLGAGHGMVCLVEGCMDDFVGIGFEQEMHHPIYFYEH